jgi:AraC family transcriptional regulator
MDWKSAIDRAIDYIEEHITERIDYEEVAKRAYSSSFHFQRVFGITCGCTLGEYIRRRKLSLAGSDLLAGNMKVIDVAYKYGYETPESFSRAFMRFHGILPSQVKKGSSLKSFSRLAVKFDLVGGSTMNYRIENRPEIVLTGYKKRFTGAPSGEERAKQEEQFFCCTRAKQWLLRGMACGESAEIDYCVVDNVDDDGYDFYIASHLSEWGREVMYDHSVTGVDFMEDMEFEDIVIPARTYLVFETDKMKKPISAYVDIRKKIVQEWLPSVGYVFDETPLPDSVGTRYVFDEGPELVVLHWARKPNSQDRYVEICLPIAEV